MTTPRGDGATSQRTLVLLRHAKSAYPEGVADFSRPLAPRGERDAPAAGRTIADRVGVPDLVIVSTSTRTRQTWQLASAAWARPPHCRFDGRVYDASVDDLLLLLREIEHRYVCVVVVGHNPGMEDLAFAVDDGLGDPDAIARMGRKFPTCGLAVFDIARPWEHLVEAGGRLRAFEVARGNG